MRKQPAAARAALETLSGLGLATLAFFAVSPFLAAGILIALLYLTPGRVRMFGDTPVIGPADVDPRALRQYREDHPGATIGDAIAAMRGRTEDGRESE